MSVFHGYFTNKKRSEIWMKYVFFPQTPIKTLAPEPALKQVESGMVHTLGGQVTPLPSHAILKSSWAPNIDCACGWVPTLGQGTNMMSRCRPRGIYWNLRERWRKRSSEIQLYSFASKCYCQHRSCSSQSSSVAVIIQMSKLPRSWWHGQNSPGKGTHCIHWRPINCHK